VDLARFIAGAKIESISAMVMEEARKLEDTLVLNLRFENGTVAAVSYFSNGNKKLNKEYLEVFSSGKVAIIDDFRNMIVHTNKTWKDKLKKQDKGHKEEVRRFLAAIEQGLPTPISFGDIYSSTSAIFKAIESINSGQTIKV
jgi:predicted dehydrogenase